MFPIFLTPYIPRQKITFTAKNNSQRHSNSECKKKSRSVRASRARARTTRHNSVEFAGARASRGARTRNKAAATIRAIPYFTQRHASPWQWGGRPGHWLVEEGSSCGRDRELEKRRRSTYNASHDISKYIRARACTFAMRSRRQPPGIPRATISFGVL